MMQSFLDKILAPFSGNAPISSQESDRVLALAGLFQAAALVKQAAHLGTVDAPLFETQINSVLELSPTNLTDIYGAPNNMTLGLKSLIAFIRQPPELRDKELAGYVVGLIVLQRKLMKSPQLIAKIRARIPFVHTQITHYGILNPVVIANLADIYLNSLSQFNVRIQVKGSRQYLESEGGINTVRALLLTGIRSAVLWQQLGGQFYQLFLSRNRLAQVAEHILQTLPPKSDKETV